MIEMFGFFGTRQQTKTNGYRGSCPIARCRVFYREPLAQSSLGVYVEVQNEGRHLVYVANRGVTPAYLDTPYDEWCRQQLLESYVFSSLDTAQTYFQRRHGEAAPDLETAVRSQMVPC